MIASARAQPLVWRAISSSASCGRDCEAARASAVQQQGPPSEPRARDEVAVVVVPGHTKQDQTEVDRAEVGTGPGQPSPQQAKPARRNMIKFPDPGRQLAAAVADIQSPEAAVDHG
ncbi:hypothetical protein [Spirillospora sp. NPDC048824]|uniref:hypothetical protein n=1 Tax=Spirillospora sp. NPDC048824 TaxID=3364526 RepID=UPI0037209717